MQIYVEVPRARLTMELAGIKESQGNITEAADVLQELQVRGREGRMIRGDEGGGGGGVGRVKEERLQTVISLPGGDIWFYGEG